MLEKGDLEKYAIVVLILAGLVGILFFFGRGPTGYAVYYEGPGAEQTTLMLQIADSDNLGDAYVDGGIANKNKGVNTDLKVQKNPYQRTYIKFNISGIPLNQIIDNSQLCLYLYNDQGTQTVYVSHVYVHDWNEGSEDGTDVSGENYTTNITWNNQPCGADFDNLTNCNLTAESSISDDGTLDETWQCWNVTNAVSYEYNSQDENVSIVLYTEDFGNPDIFYSKESSDSGLYPYLNITYHSANTPPSITLVSPQNGATYGYNESIALDFFSSDNEDNIGSCWYNIDDENNISLAGCLNTTFDIAGNGDYDLNIYVNDSLGLVSSDSVSFSVSIGSPTIILNSPIDDYLNNGQNIEFSYTPTDVDLDYCELWGDFTGSFSLNQTDASPTSGVENIFNLNLSDGTYLWNIKCVDDIGNFAFNGNKTFYIDTIAPVVSLIEPTGDKTSRTISANWGVSDASPVNCLYNVYQGASLEIANTSISCSASSTSFDVSVDASFVFNFYVNDSAGNTNSANSSFSVDTSTVVIPPSSGGGGGGGGSYILPNQTGKLQVSLIGNIIANPGENKKIPLVVKNIWRIFLNKCRLIAKGDIGLWIYSTNIEGIAPGQSVDFVFDLNVPEETVSEVNKGSLEIKCEEASNIQNISVSIPKEFGLIEIKDIKQEEDILKISYVLDSSKFVGENIDVEIWLSNENGTELVRVFDKSPINREGLIERNIEMQLPEDLEGGVYFINFAFSNDINNFIKKPVILSITGKAVLDSEKGKLWVYILFLAILGVASFFIWRRHGKTDKIKKLKKIIHHKPRWLLRKKK